VEQCILIDAGKETEMTDTARDLQSLGRRFVGEWTTEATHPAVPGTVVRGTASVEWLEGERFLVFRTRSEHPDFPDSISIIGDTDGLQMHAFDSRGIHRILELTVTAEGWELAPDAAGEWERATDGRTIASRLLATFADEDNTIIGTWQISSDNKTWDNDLQITYHRAR
jgi:hypothetical protein